MDKVLAASEGGDASKLREVILAAPGPHAPAITIGYRPPTALVISHWWGQRGRRTSAVGFEMSASPVRFVCPRSTARSRAISEARVQQQKGSMFGALKVRVR